jgi:DNA-binding IscR family transcriptional regulator
MTSEDLAACLQTNAAVVRRTMAGLRDAGIVTSGKGHGGGWTLAGDLTIVTLRDVYAALGEPMLFQIEAQSESPGCLVEAAINRVLTDALRDAEAVFLDRLANVALADLRLAQDGRPGSEILSAARQQVAAYPTATFPGSMRPETRLACRAALPSRRRTALRPA